LGGPVMRKFEWSLVLGLALLLVLAFLPACGGDNEDKESDGDKQIDGDTETLTEQELEGETESPATGLRCVLVKDGDALPEGPEAVGIAGDYLLANDKVRFVIQGENRSRTWVPYTGTLVDADLVRPVGEGQDNLGEVSTITAILRGFCPDRFTIVENGSDGETAQLSVHGVDCGIPIADIAIPIFKPLKYDITVDYILKKDDNALAIVTTVVNNGSARDVRLGDGLVWGNRLRALTPTVGFGMEGVGASDGFPYQLAIGEKIVYGFGLPSGLMSVPISSADILPFMSFSEKVKAGGTASITRLFVVGETAEEVRARFIEARGESTQKIKVNVTRADTADANEVFDVLVLDSFDRPFAQAVAKDDKAEFAVVPGSYKVVLRQLGRPDSEAAPVTVSNKDESVSLTLPATGRINFHVSGDRADGSVGPLPARVSVQAGENADPASSILRRAFTTDGEGHFLLEPGTYTLTAYRGYEYEIDQENITVTATGTADFNATLTRSVDTTGWIATDTHMHTERSIDTTVPVNTRVMNLAAIGLELMPITDHDVISVLDPLVPTLGLRDYLRLMPGIEISPPWGHCNAIQVVDRDDRPLYFGAPWYKGYDEDGMFIGAMTMPEIWAAARDLYGAKIIQINHPRDSIGYFDSIDFDSTKPVSEIKEGAFDTNFDGVELINANGVEDALNKVLPDWYSFLNQGIHKAGVAVSDCHTESCPGDARSYLRVGSDNPNEVTDAQFEAAYKGMHAVAASGPFIDAKIGDAGPGDTATGGAPFMLSIKVQAPSWMAVDWVRVVVNGQQFFEDAVTGTEPLRYTKQLEVTNPGKDFWVVVLAGAPTKRLVPVSPSQPILSIANAIFVDQDGNGYTPPGM